MQECCLIAVVIVTVMARVADKLVIVLPWYTLTFLPHPVDVGTPKFDILGENLVNNNLLPPRYSENQTKMWWEI